MTTRDIGIFGDKAKRQQQAPFEHLWTVSERWIEDKAPNFPAVRQQGRINVKSFVQLFRQGQFARHGYESHGADQLTMPLEGDRNSDFVSFFSSRWKYGFNRACTSRSIS